MNELSEFEESSSPRRDAYMEVLIDRLFFQPKEINHSVLFFRDVWELVRLDLEDRKKMDINPGKEAENVLRIAEQINRGYDLSPEARTPLIRFLNEYRRVLKSRYGDTTHGIQAMTVIDMLTTIATYTHPEPPTS